jgi:hypothetical protein
VGYLGMLSSNPILSPGIWLKMQNLCLREEEKRITKKKRKEKELFSFLATKSKRA